MTSKTSKINKYFKLWNNLFLKHATFRQIWVHEHENKKGRRSQARTCLDFGSALVKYVHIILVQSMSEIRTSDNRTTPKSEQIPIRYDYVRFSVVRDLVFVFGFRTS